MSNSKKVRIAGIFLAIIGAGLVGYYVFKEFIDYALDTWTYRREADPVDYLFATLLGGSAAGITGVLLWGSMYGVSMLIRERCSFCNNHKTEQLNEEGRLICHTCAIQQRMDAEPVRNCPEDSQPMTKEVIIDEVIIDRCPTCHGVWFSHNELELLMDHMESQSSSSFATGLVVGIAID